MSDTPIDHRDHMGRKWEPDPTGRYVYRANEMGRWSEKVKNSVDGAVVDRSDASASALLRAEDPRDHRGALHPGLSP